MTDSEYNDPNVGTDDFIRRSCQAMLVTLNEDASQQTILGRCWTRVKLDNGNETLSLNKQVFAPVAGGDVQRLSIFKSFLLLWRGKPHYDLCDVAFLGYTVDPKQFDYIDDDRLEYIGYAHNRDTDVRTHVYGSAWILDARIAGQSVCYASLLDRRLNDNYATIFLKPEGNTDRLHLVFDEPLLLHSVAVWYAVTEGTHFGASVRIAWLDSHASYRNVEYHFELYSDGQKIKERVFQHASYTILYDVRVDHLFLRMVGSAKTYELHEVSVHRLLRNGSELSVEMEDRLPEDMTLLRKVTVACWTVVLVVGLVAAIYLRYYTEYDRTKLDNVELDKAKSYNALQQNSLHTLASNRSVQKLARMSSLNLTARKIESRLAASAVKTTSAKVFSSQVRLANSTSNTLGVNRKWSFLDSIDSVGFPE